MRLPTKGKGWAWWDWGKGAWFCKERGKKGQLKNTRKKEAVTTFQKPETPSTPAKREMGASLQRKNPDDAHPKQETGQWIVERGLGGKWVVRLKQRPNGKKKRRRVRSAPIKKPDEHTMTKGKKAARKACAQKTKMSS